MKMKQLKTIITAILITTILTPSTFYATNEQITEQLNGLFINGEELINNGVIDGIILYQGDIFISLPELVPWEFSNMDIGDLAIGQTFSFTDFLEFEFTWGSDYFTVNAHQLPLTRPLLHLNGVVYIPLQDWALRFGLSTHLDTNTGIVRLNGVRIILREIFGNSVYDYDFFDEIATPVFVVNERVFVPWTIFIGMDGIWEQDRVYIIDRSAELELVFTIGSDYFIANGHTVALDVPVQMFYGIPFLPIRAIGEIYSELATDLREDESFFVEWDEGTSTVYLVFEAPPSEPLAQPSDGDFVDLLEMYFLYASLRNLEMIIWNAQTLLFYPSGDHLSLATKDIEQLFVRFDDIFINMMHSWLFRNEIAIVLEKVEYHLILLWNILHSGHFHENDKEMIQASRDMTLGYVLELSEQILEGQSVFDNFDNLDYWLAYSQLRDIESLFRQAAAISVMSVLDYDDWLDNLHAIEGQMADIILEPTAPLSTRALSTSDLFFLWDIMMEYFDISFNILMAVLSNDLESAQNMLYTRQDIFENEFMLFLDIFEIDMVMAIFPQFTLDSTPTEQQIAMDEIIGALFAIDGISNRAYSLAWSTLIAHGEEDTQRLYELEQFIKEDMERVIQQFDFIFSIISDMDIPPDDRAALYTQIRDMYTQAEEFFNMIIEMNYLAQQNYPTSLAEMAYEIENRADELVDAIVILLIDLLGF